MFIQVGDFFRQEGRSFGSPARRSNGHTTDTFRYSYNARPREQFLLPDGTDILSSRSSLVLTRQIIA